MLHVCLKLETFVVYCVKSMKELLIWKVRYDFDCVFFPLFKHLSSLFLNLG